jgi:hypothetical protein
MRGGEDGARSKEQEERKRRGRGEEEDGSGWQEGRGLAACLSVCTLCSVQVQVQQAADVSLSPSLSPKAFSLTLLNNVLVTCRLTSASMRMVFTSYKEWGVGSGERGAGNKAQEEIKRVQEWRGLVSC